MSVMVVPLEFVRWEIGNKKGPENEGLVRSLHAFSGRASGQPNPSLEAGPRIRRTRVRSTQSLSGGGAAHSCFGARICDDVHHGLLIIMSPSHPLIKWPQEIRAPRDVCGEVCSRSNDKVNQRPASF